MKGRILKQILRQVLASILVSILLMFNFLIIGQNIVMAMGEDTNLENVKFDAYLKNGENITHEKEVQISNEELLTLNINVTGTGVFNDGKISIENPNFRIVQDKINNSYVKSVNTQTNEIELNPIVYKNDIKIEIPILFNKQDQFEQDYFQKEININLEGTYKTDTDKKIYTQRKIKINWTQDTDVVLSQEIEKYKSIDSNKNVLLQQRITTEVLNNALPRESENLLVQVPILDNQQPKQIYVICNGIKLSEENVQFNKETNVLEIKNANPINQNNKIIWGSGANTYQVVYIYDQNVNFQKRTIQLKSCINTKLFTKNFIQKQEDKSLEIEEKGNILSSSKAATNALYKGYLYAKTENETTFIENNMMQISNVEAIDEIHISNASEQFIDNYEKAFDISENVVYKNTKIQKEEFNRIFGEDGQITITDQNENIFVINKDTEVDGQGNIVINYEIPTKSIEIVTSKPISEGNFTISSTKSIKSNNNYTKEQLKTFVKLDSKTNIITNISQETIGTEISLLDTKTEANISINNPNLSTLQNNDNVQLLITLKSNNEQYDLYKNPSVDITFPKELEISQENISQLNAQEQLQITNKNLYKNENGETVLHLELRGEQKAFENNINEGIQIAITASISIQKETPTKQSQITMNYTNENRQGESFSAVTPIQLNSKYGVLTVNKLSNYNENQDVVETIDDKVTNATLDKLSSAKEAKQQITIVNNYESEITDLVIIGKIPTQEKEKVGKEILNSTFEMKLKQQLNVEGKESKVYYSQDANATTDSNTWQDTIEDITTAKAFKVELPENNISAGETIKLAYPLEIPEGLKENESTYTKLTLNYKYQGEALSSNSTISLETEEEQEKPIVKTMETDKITVELQGRTAGKTLAENQEVYEGQGVRYILKITNTSEEDLNNINIKATQNNAIFYDYVTYHDGWDSGTDTEGVDYRLLEEVPDLTEKEISIDTLPVGQSVEVGYQFSVKEVEGEGETTSGKIKIFIDEEEEQQCDTYTNPIKQAELKLQLKDKYEVDDELETGGIYPFFFDVKNISGQVQNDVILEYEVPEGFYFERDYLFDTETEGYEFISYEDRILTLKIPQIDISQTISIRLMVDIEDIDYSLNQKDYNFIYKATLNEKEYFSNELKQTIHNFNTFFVANQVGSVEGNEVKNGDKLNYIFTLENQGNIEKEISINDSVPIGAVISKVTVEIYNISEEEDTLTQTREITNIEENNINDEINLGPNQRYVLTIETTIDTSQIFEEEITNEIDLATFGQEIKCNSVTYKVIQEKDPDDTDDPDNPIDPDDPNNPIDPDDPDNPTDPDDNETYNIQGVAWEDENKNGSRESREKLLKDIEVLLVKDNEITTTSSTDENGNYEFTDLEKGKYTVIFKYNTQQYQITQYQKEGINETNNSDVIAKKINLDGVETNVAITETLELENEDLLNIDAGFIEAEKFDFKLDKYVDRIIVQNNKGTTVRQYDKEKLAKVEIDSKEIINSTVLIEYKMIVTNEGEVPGYVNEIIDYKPEDLTFSSEINKNWYQSTNGQLITKELTNEIIQPNETKEITLTLVKTMTANNIQTSINTAEIYKTSNDFSLSDIDSVEGNKVEDEDDISTAEVIISLRTGSAIIYFTLITTMIIVLAVGIYLINKKVLKTQIRERR